MTDGQRDGPIVVTGGAGAVGSSLVRQLLARGREVRVVDNLSNGRREHLPPDGTPGLSVTIANVLEPAQYSHAFERASEVWHFAANTDIRRGTNQPRLDLDEGTLATFAVLEQARRHDVRRVIFSSSSVVYGFPTVFPTPEGYGPLFPQSLYAASKLAAEGLCSSYAYTYGFQVHLFRFANIIGPGMTHGVIYDFFEKLRTDPRRLEVLGDGRQAKSYLRVEDCIEGMLLATAKSTDPVNLFNLGTRDRISAREIAEKVVAAHGDGARIEFTGGERGWVGDVPQQLLSIDRIERLGWRPRWNSGEAVDRTIAELVESRRLRA
ncbi:MAG: NAD-dependent epimerase/dehydratase family protein [Thermoplasmata archaeon]